MICMSEQLKQPYVGVSGVVSPEIESALETMAAEAGLFDKNRVLALGVKAVHKTQFLDIENKYGQDWYPVGEESFKNALRRENRGANTIAVAQAYLDVEYVHDSDYRTAFLARIVQRAEPWLQAIQFDMLPWHTNYRMWGFLEDVKHEGVDVFLQAHGAAMKILGPKDCARILGQHAELVDYVLFDASHGTGTRLDKTYLNPFIAEAHERLDPSQTGIAIAGGLNGDIVREVLPGFINKYPNLSWDAEGQLHPLDKHGKHPLDLEVTREYLQASSEILS